MTGLIDILAIGMVGGLWYGVAWLLGHIVPDEPNPWGRYGSAESYHTHWNGVAQHPGSHAT